MFEIDDCVKVTHIEYGAVNDGSMDGFIDLTGVVRNSNATWTLVAFGENTTYFWNDELELCSK